MSSIREYRNLIGGKLCPPLGGLLFDSVNPSTGDVWARFPDSGQSDVDAAVAAATAAFPAWSRLTASARCAHLQRVADLFIEHGEELACIESTDNGNLISMTRQINGAGASATWKRAAHETLAAITGRSVELGRHTQGFTRREPYGVVAAIVPFNMPIGMFSGKVASALAGGNTVVVKPPDQASAGILRVGELLADVLPPGVVNIVAGDGVVGDALVRHEDVAKVTMTGSSATARLIQRAAADTLTPSIFELGGKSPNIVFADADLEAAAYGVTLPSIFGFNAGQACVAGSRILVERSVLDEMLERIRAIAQSIVIGDPFDETTMMGPIISRKQYERVIGYLEVGVKEATLLFGGRYGSDIVPHLPGGYWIEPTLFMTEDNSTRICRDEIFGPVGTVLPFDTDDEAIAIANDSRYGLAAGVWTRDMARVHRCIRDIQAGNVWVNTYLQTRYELPFGGFKESGYGHDTVIEFTREKSAVVAIPR